MTTTAVPLPVNYPTEAVIEATTPEVLRKKSDAGSVGVGERVYGLAARVMPGITFEEYQYWAKIERDLEDDENRRYVEERGPMTVKRLITDRFSKGVHHDQAKKRQKAENEQSSSTATDAPKRNSVVGVTEIAEKDGVADLVVAPADDGSSELDAEWRQAARALRTAGWGTIFYLVTTDILGWSSCPFVFASVGYGTGVGVYVVFGMAAAFAAWGIWRPFLGLDSSRYPMLSFGDLYFRIFGPRARHFINVMQSLQQFLTVAVLIIGNGSTLAEIAESKICYIACFIICMVIGMMSGMFRGLQKIGWLCNASVWMNVINFIIIMVASKINPIYYPAVTNSTLIKKIEPVKTFVGLVPDAYQQQAHGFAGIFNGVNSMVYAYSGALLFVAFLGEMRRPMDFWKGVFLAQAFICFVYILFGAYVYSNFGQYSSSLIGTVILPFALQTVGNVLTLLTGLIACLLYFNIGMKTVYLEVFQELLHFPSIVTTKGKIAWYALGPLYWILAFIVAASVPNLNVIVSVVGGLFSLNFTYSLPVLAYFGYNIQKDAALPGEGFDPHTCTTIRHDNGWKRLLRGFMKRWWFHTPVGLFILASFACSGMGTWAGVEGAIAVFGPGGTVATSFGCGVPV